MVVLSYCVILLLVTLPILIPPERAWESFWASIFSMPWILMMSLKPEFILINILICGVINSSIIYLILWGMTKLIIIMAKSGSQSET